MLKWQKVKDPGGRTIGYTATGTTGRTYNAENTYWPLRGWLWSDGDFGRHQTETLRAAKYQAQQRENYWQSLV